MLTKEIIEGFKTSEQKFKILAAEVITFVHGELKVYVNDIPSSFGGRKVLFKKNFVGEVFVALEVFADGYVTFKYGKGDNILSCTPEIFFRIHQDKNQNQLKEAIIRAKKHLGIQEKAE